jgi:hypothetical protein
VVAGKTAPAGGAGQVEDVAAPARHHARQQGADELKRRRQVERDDFRGFLGRLLVQRLYGSEAAGIVDQHVDFLPGELAGDRRMVSHVGWKRQQAGAEPVGHALKRGLVPREGVYRQPFIDERFGDGGADALRGPCNERSSVLHRAGPLSAGQYAP